MSENVKYVVEYIYFVRLNNHKVNTKKFLKKVPSKLLNAITQGQIKLYNNKRVITCPRKYPKTVHPNLNTTAILRTLRMQLLTGGCLHRQPICRYPVNLKSHQFFTMSFHNFLIVFQLAEHFQPTQIWHSSFIKADTGCICKDGISETFTRRTDRCDESFDQFHCWT